MSIVENLIEWSRQTFLPYGELGLFLIAFMESSFFPIPPDIILIPLALLEPGLALWYALICTLGSVTGSVLGYYIGRKGGRPLIKKITSRKRRRKVEKMFKKHGALGIGISAFSPIPYKIFTITSGMMKYDLKKLLGVSLIGRGGRFFLEAIVIMFFGEEIMNFVLNYFEIATLLVVAVIVVFYLVYRRLLNSS